MADLKVLNTQTEIDELFETLKQITSKALSEGRKIQYQRFPSVPPKQDESEEQASVNTWQINVWDKVISIDI